MSAGHELALEVADAALELDEAVRERKLGFGSAERRIAALTRADDAIRAFRDWRRLNPRIPLVGGTS